MKIAAMLSRRVVLGAFAASLMPIARTHPVRAHSADTCLLELGRSFDAISGLIDQLTENGSHFPDGLLQQLDQVTMDISSLQATTSEGMCAKARVICWGRLGDLDLPDNLTLDEKMALSIVRDLIRLHDPSLERPGALSEMVSEIQADTDGL